MKLYVNPASQHARRVQMLALELGLDAEITVLDFAKGENRQPAYLALNPAGKVPTLEDDGLVLWESNAIMQYVCDKKGPTSLYPADLKQRADVNRWLFWESAHFGRACATLTMENVVKPMLMNAKPDPALVAAAELELARFAKILDAQLEKREYVCGKLTIADLALASILMYRVPAKMDLAAFPHLGAWLSRIEARDSWKKTQPQM